MAAFARYPNPYFSHEYGHFHYQTMTGAQYHDQDHSGSSIDPTLRDGASEYALFAPDMSCSQHESLQLYPSLSNPMHLSSSTIAHQSFEYDQLGAPLYYDGPRDSPYSSPAGPSNGNLSDESSEYGWNSEISRTMPPHSGTQTETFKFAPLPSDVQMSQQTMWSTDSSFLPPLTPTSEIVPRLQSIAMKELEFEPPNHASERQFFDDRMSSVHVQFCAQPTPEELDLSESIDGLAPSFRSSVMFPHTAELSEAGSLASEHSPRSENEPNLAHGQRSQSYAPNQHVLPSSYGRTNSVTSVRSVRGGVPSHAVLDTHSRVHKGRSPKGATPSQPTAKDRSRTKIASQRLTTAERSRADKQTKFFPCTFHLFGCSSTFGNKNEWKRHVYSQHLQLCFYRCDMGDCNPEYNPKLYVPSSTSRTNTIKHEIDDHDLDEEKDVIFNDFNRKDLFTQHCRRMHGPLRYATDNTTMTNKSINARIQRQQSSTGGGGSSKSKSKAAVTKDDEAAFEVELDEIRSRCRTLRRKAPARTSCGFCGEVFRAEPMYTASNSAKNVHDEGRAEERAWEERMEHVGRHYERDGYSPQREGIDDDLVEWGLSVGILENVVDTTGMQRPWLAGCEIRSLPLHSDETDEDAIKVTGIRHKSEQKRAGLRSKKDLPRFQTCAAVLSDSDEDASAEED